MSGDEDGAPIWARPEPGARHSRLTRERIAAAALEIADSEGFGAVSMRRVAAELDAGTMSLYHYVRSKGDLIALMDDALMAEALVSEGEMPDSWREALTLIARRTWALLVRHPWALLSLPEARFGPNAMRHTEQSLAAADGTGLDARARLELLALVDDYVVGNALHTSESLKRAAAARADPEAVRASVEFGLDQLRTGAFPRTEALLGGRDPRRDLDGSVGPSMDVQGLGDRFERGLQAVLDGAERRMGLPFRSLTPP
jgi:AcrR family transcriptional regulator